MPSIDQETMLQMYHRMWLIRRFENKAAELFSRGILAKGGVHSSVGQEAVAVGVCFALAKDDWITSTHRGHGHHLAKGADPRRLMAELLGKEEGYCKGRGGSMHIASFEVGSLGAFAVVAEGAPVAVGAGLAEAMRGGHRIAASFIGDGALGQGALYEAFNMASVWKLPVVFVCERNGIAVSTDCDTMVAPCTRIDDLAQAFNLHYYGVDGQDVVQVNETAQAAVLLARQGQGPSIVDCRTWRFEGHYAGEPQVYRKREDLQEMRNSQDPIAKFQSYLIENAIASSRDLEEIKRTADQEVEKACDFAQHCPDPDPSAYAEYVYA